MTALQLLKSFQIKSSNHDLMSMSDYYWSNTKLKTGEDWNLETGVNRIKSIAMNLQTMLQMLIDTKKITENFTIVELFCGDGTLLYCIKEMFPKCKCIGIDLLHHETWKTIKSKQSNHNFLQINFHDLYHMEQKLNLDVMITFNTFRGWNNGIGPENTKNKVTINEFIDWAHKNFKYNIVDGPKFI